MRNVQVLGCVIIARDRTLANAKMDTRALPVRYCKEKHQRVCFYLVFFKEPSVLEPF